MVKCAPLPSSFMLISIIGFFISWLVVYNRFPSWGFAFMLVFVVMFVASVVSMTKAEVETRETLYLHTMPEKNKAHRERIKAHASKKK